MKSIGQSAAGTHTTVYCTHTHTHTQHTHMDTHTQVSEAFVSHGSHDVSSEGPQGTLWSKLLWDICAVIDTTQLLLPLVSRSLSLSLIP